MEIREAKREDLQGLLELYTYLHDNPIPEEQEHLLSLWNDILQDKNHHVVIGITENQIVSSCILVVVPNLTHN